MIKMTISKVLSANDSGETGGHQAGLVIPKKEDFLSFFPMLDSSKLNPRAHLHFEDQAGHSWEFAFIYYNNRFFGGTRNEYRLTRMMQYFRECGLVTGDEVVMDRGSDRRYFISYRRSKKKSLSIKDKQVTVLRLGTGWKLIGI